MAPFRWSHAACSSCTNLARSCVCAAQMGAPGRIRTCVGVSRRIYSPYRAFARRGFRPNSGSSMSSRTTLTISGIDLKYIVAQYTSQLAGNGACSRGASSCVGGAVAVWVTEDPHGWRADVSAPAATGGERLRLRSSSPNQTSLAFSLRRPRLTPRLNAPDACRQPISVGHQYAKSSSSMIVRKLVGARTSSTHDHVARPQCRQLCKCRDRRHKAPKKKPSLSQHRFWHHCGDGCAFGAGSQ